MKLETKNWEVTLGCDPCYFEHQTQARGGNLYFDDDVLVDYDGLSYMPAEVIDALRRAGYTVDEEFE